MVPRKLDREISMGHHIPPMPLKHFTETFLVVLLGAVIVCTGLLIATLPDLPEGALPWAVLFVLSLVYPLSLYSLFQARRADNLFRNLHWFPALMLLIWLALQGVVLSGLLSLAQIAVYTWGWTLGAVVVGFVFLVAFCLKVIRRRLPRLIWLGLILVPFAALAMVSQQGDTQYEGQLASILWGSDFWNVDEAGMLASWLQMRAIVSDTTNVNPSDDAGEEAWRERLRMQQRREERIAARSESEGSSKNSEGSAMATSDSSSSVSVMPEHTSSTMMIGQSSSMPSKLPSAGFSWSAILLTLAGAYCASLHASAQRRRG